MEECCKNCKNIIVNNFCGYCGQKKFERIDKKYIIHEIQYLIIHINKGFFYSIKEILRNPGRTAKNYIEGNRVNHYRPILLAMFLGGISTYISFKLLHLDGIIIQMNSESTSEVLNISIIEKILDFLSHYNTLLILLLIPIISLFSYSCFKKTCFNYYEHVVANIFFYIQVLLINILLSPIRFFYIKNIFITNFLSDAIIIINILLLFWFYKEIIPAKNNMYILTRMLLFLITTVLFFYIVIFIYVLIMMQ